MNQRLHLTAASRTILLAAAGELRAHYASLRRAMSKFACRCGNIISDAVYPCPTEGDLRGQQDNERLQKESVKAVGAFVAALLAGWRQEWIRGFFLSGYPDDISDELVISDILSRFEIKYHKSVAECDRCGRLWVQMRSGENQYRSYAPDEIGYAAVLRGQRSEG